MAMPDENLLKVLKSYEDREVQLELPTGTGELSGQKNETDETRDKITHVEALGRSIIGSVQRVCYGHYQGQPACFISLRFTFRYVRDSILRFKKSEIVISFDKRPTQAIDMTKDPIVRAFSPRKIYGLPTTEEKKFIYQVGLQLSVGAGPAGLGPQAQAEIGSTFKKDHRLEIIGLEFSDRRRPNPNKVIWTVDEGGKTDWGIPDELNVAAIVVHDGSFQADIKIKVDTPLKDALFGNLWTKDDPLLFIPPLSKGDILRTDQFDLLDENDWKELVPYCGERKDMPIFKST